MKKTINSDGRQQFVNPIGLRTAEPFKAKGDDGKNWIRLNYGSKDDAILIGPYDSEEQAISVIRFITE